jgi:dTDP-4-dehydrorhamnose reductase
MNNKSVLLLGASGLVGGKCLKLLIHDGPYEKITILTRSPLTTDIKDSRVHHHIIDFDRLGEYRHLMKADHVICALGTTIKKAGTKENFHRVDFTYPYEIARIASEHGSEHYLLVSSMGAHPGSSIFYNRVKGELEQAVQKLTYRSVSIFRPSLILGQRHERRIAEQVSKVIAEIFSFAIPERYKPVQAADIARAILKVAGQDRDGIRIIESDEITRIA